MSAEGSGRGSRLVRAMAISYAGFAGGLASSVAVSRILGVDGKGVFSLFTATVTGLMTVATIGVPHGQMYHVVQRQNWLRHFMANAYVFALGLGGGVAAVYFGVGGRLGLRTVAQLPRPLLVVGIVAVPIGVLLTYQRQFLLVRGRYELSKASFALSQGLPALAYLALALTGRATVIAVVGVYVAIQVVVSLFFVIPIRRAEPAGRSFSPELARASLHFGFRQFCSDVALYLTSRLDFFLVALYLGSAGLGIYSVAVAMAEVTTRVANELGTMLFPVFADREGGQSYGALILRVVLLISVALAVGLAVVSGPVIRLLFGDRFLPALVPFRWLLVGTIAWSSIHVTWPHTSASGRPLLGVPIFAAAAAVDALLNVVLLPRLGVVAASIAADVSYIAAAGAFLIVFRRAHNVSWRDLLIAKASDVRLLIATVGQVLAGLRRRIRLSPDGVAR